MIKKIINDSDPVANRHCVSVKINEIIDVVNEIDERTKSISITDEKFMNAAAKKLETECIHEWTSNGFNKEDYYCSKCGHILDCEHKWEPYVNNQRCKICGIIK